MEQGLLAGHYNIDLSRIQYRLNSVSIGYSQAQSLIVY